MVIENQMMGQSVEQHRHLVCNLLNYNVNRIPPPLDLMIQAIKDTFHVRADDLPLRAE